eukprot:GHVR01174835.1.p1 GENE.GHVR01174835.1~~GHVR01174835.1.p1  ORF type:complete len:307 (-),score=81.51 GHVR01174835.1:20-940(-)
MSKCSYLSVVSECIKWSQDTMPITVRLILSINRARLTSPEAAFEELEETLELAHTYRDIVVGIDIAGNPSKGSLSTILQLIRCDVLGTCACDSTHTHTHTQTSGEKKCGRYTHLGLGVTVHIGELPPPTSITTLPTHEETRHTTHEETRHPLEEETRHPLEEETRHPLEEETRHPLEEETALVLSLPPHRVGHACYISDDELNTIIREGIHLEVCPSSNKHTMKLCHISQHHLPRYVFKGLQNFSINCDDIGVCVFCTHIYIIIHLWKTHTKTYIHVNTYIHINTHTNTYIYTHVQKCIQKKKRHF